MLNDSPYLLHEQSTHHEGLAELDGRRERNRPRDGLHDRQHDVLGLGRCLLVLRGVRLQLRADVDDAACEERAEERAHLPCVPQQLRIHQVTAAAGTIQKRDCSCKALLLACAFMMGFGLIVLWPAARPWAAAEAAGSSGSIRHGPA